MATKRLEFINVSDPSDAKAASIRTKVRKHVMKDIGRARRRPKKGPITFELILNPQCQLGSREIDPFVRFPIEMGKTEKSLLSMIFRDVDCTQYAHRYEWFSVALLDEATMLLVLSNSAAHRDRASGLPLGQKSPDASELYLRALASVNRRLLEPKPEISDGLVGAIAGLMTHNDIVGNFEEWTLHVHGLEQLLDMRGGISTISTRELKDTILYIELRGAFYQDIVPRFPLSVTWIPYMTVEDGYHGTLESSDLILQWKLEHPTHTVWPHIYKDLVHYSLLTQEESTLTSGRSWLESTHGGNWPNAQIHRITSWRPLQDTLFANSAAIKEEFLRLASLFYLGILWAKFGVLPLGTAIYSEKLYELHRRYPLSWGELWPFAAWCLLVGAVGSSGERRQYFFEEIWALCLRDGVSVDKALRKAKGVMWVEDAFEDVDIYREMTRDMTVVQLE
ncbi:Ubiquitin carboxyl-terminal hydrolase 16 [Venturia nashicola]|uniref:Ubiquitin carboxyl-terminal hydrolase 16 n=1 Tax=Venturia nashicola TaxID=86259 RepID=A0A4Z1PBA8_9PEZI|nr:Ubiquitin carboxyl-terminal hydrolase 16 [Venturia nashicola]TLD38600.1 Ubiquitin carboxyl-terminal hydrolase 16 [Venturia nashicola]